MERVKQLAASFTGNTVASLEVKRPEDVVITLAVRSPLCKVRFALLSSLEPRFMFFFRLGKDHSKM